MIELLLFWMIEVILIKARVETHNQTRIINNANNELKSN